jgi:MFS family permease
VRRRGADSVPSFYGWTIVRTLAVTETISWGIVYYAFTVFIAPMEADLGWSRAELTGGFSLALLVMAGAAYPVGGWVDKRGPRALMTAGSLLASLLVVAWSRVSDLTAFYLIWALLGLCAAAILYEPAFATVATWFSARRGRALAVMTFAAGLASTIFIPLSDWLLGAVGWRDAVLILGIVLGVTTVPLHAVILRRHPGDFGLEPDGTAHHADTRERRSGASLSDALRNRYFWLVTVAFALVMLSSNAIRVHFIPFLLDAGIDPSTAALASGAIGIMQVVGRVAFAPLEPRLSNRALMCGVFGLQAAAAGVLLLGTMPLLIVLFIVSFGASVGASTLTRATVIADQYGAASYGRISSVMSLFVTVAGTAAPVAAALVYDRFGSYQPVIIAVVGLAAAATMLAAVTKPAASSLRPNL